MASLCFLAHVQYVDKHRRAMYQKGGDHVLCLSYLKNAFLGRNVMLFH